MGEDSVGEREMGEREMGEQGLVRAQIKDRTSQSQLEPGEGGVFSALATATHCSSSSQQHSMTLWVPLM